MLTYFFNCLGQLFEPTTTILVPFLSLSCVALTIGIAKMLFERSK